MIGALLKAYIIKTGTTQVSLYKKLEVSKAQLSKIVSGRHKPTMKVTVNILKLIMPEFEDRLDLLLIEAQSIIMKQKLNDDRQINNSMLM